MDPLSMGMSALSSVMPVVGQGLDLLGKGLDVLGKIVDAKSTSANQDPGKIGADTHQSNTVQISYNA
ncbi:MULTISPECIES: hypothetical protein [Pseudomonas]|jgi:hypothetical protein|uniref:Uncharacterized protein n=2 Tax=Pseudomonas TaxID=286 RepID=A0A4Y9TFF9_PSEFL|nr:MULTISPECIES: hypothetical protein [Pseudomonas]CRM95802.1 hypothetical protein [Pseudomonas sp. 22 E 5]MCX9152798.1 hypothetical protein [Pseudomonas sp. TB1-B1]QXH66350.1 hypothetical protein KSS96_22490 [Pseudomonas asgharzadehiana]TFW43054.1 hypothetical protein E4T65_11855 [Pseudomonas fluorescens]TKJ60089.1 hypothetical protein PspCFBP13506_18880 [Pseudomonas sp. CFBP13506]